jgi:hypothetical protein
MSAAITHHTSAYVSIRQHTSAELAGLVQVQPPHVRRYDPPYVSIRQHTSAYVSIRQHTPAYVSIRAGLLRVQRRAYEPDCSDAHMRQNAATRR